jgi:hypothetical protein
MDADDARDRFRKIRVRFPEELDDLPLTGALRVVRKGRELEILTDGNGEQIISDLRARQPEDLRLESLSLEEIFVSSKDLKGSDR